MFYWLRSIGAQLSHEIPAGPWPKDEALQRKAEFEGMNPHAAVSLDAAWEAPFEDMIRIKIRVDHFGRKSVEQGLIYKVTEARIHVMVNLRSGADYQRLGGWRGWPCGGRRESTRHLDHEALDYVEIQVKLKSGGKTTWDCGWAPAIPS